MEYNEKLKAIREDKDLTQTEIANILNTTQQQVCKYEKGSQEMTVSRLKILCEFYGVSADYILGLPQNLSWPRYTKAKSEKRGYSCISSSATP